ncbi:REP-associated tyrosine transposase [Neisseria polysaccharea]|uniref:Transposase n=1 Tax=Neisseria polysaccharea TaxID=489 RepID=A0ABV1JLK8_NEIPO
MSNYRRDFTRGAHYFFTLALQDRTKDYLIRHIDRLRLAYRETKIRYPFETAAICVLPDHLHFIMRLPEGDHDYPIRIAYLKTRFSQLIPKKYRAPNGSKTKKREAGIWQRRFWEHLIRDEQDLNNHRDYIYFNPVKHGYAASVKEWRYSSFFRDVEKGIYPLDWGG